MCKQKWLYISPSLTDFYNCIKTKDWRLLKCLNSTFNSLCEIGVGLAIFIIVWTVFSQKGHFLLNFAWHCYKNVYPSGLNDTFIYCLRRLAQNGIIMHMCDCCPVWPKLIDIVAMLWCGKHREGYIQCCQFFRETRTFKDLQAVLLLFRYITLKQHLKCVRTQ